MMDRKDKDQFKKADMEKVDMDLSLLEVFYFFLSFFFSS